MIEIQELVKTYKSHFTLTLPKLNISVGEIFGLVGNNGAGKTTFLRLLLYLVKADEGTIYIDDMDIEKDEKVKTSGIIGSFLDEKILIPYLKPREYLDFVRRIYQLNMETFEQYLKDRSDFISCNDVNTGKLIRELSTGNKMKVGIMAAMLHSPRLLILDEPFANLDPSSCMRLMEILRELNRKNHTTIVVSSHNLDHVVDLCTRIAIMHEGKIIHDMEKSEASLEKLKAYFRV